MSRIFPADTYGEGSRQHCHRPGTVTAPDFSAAQGDPACGVAIIGAGFAGLPAALHLAKAGENGGLEAQSPGRGASGRNGGFLQSWRLCGF